VDIFLKIKINKTTSAEEEHPFHIALISARPNNKLQTLW
jgi:hypothetical protein